MRPHYDAVVVGAGPAGSATAALLAARGATVLLVDRARFPRPKPCAEYLNPDVVARLARLGVLGAVAAGAAPVPGMRLVAPSGTTVTGRFADRPGLALPRDVLDAILARRAAALGAEFADGVVVDPITTTGVVALRTARSITRVSAGVIVAADGLHARVARRVIPRVQATSNRIALVTHYADVPDLPDHGEMHVTAFGYVGVAPVGGGLLNASVVVDRTREAPRRDAAAWFDALVARVPGIAGRLAAGRRVDRVRGVGPFGRRARRAVADRLLLVGDAADFFDPFTGDGIWAALAGAELAAEAAMTPGRLHGYTAARRRLFGGKWIVDRLVSAAVGRPRLFDHVARRLAARPALADTLVRVTGHVLPATRALNPRFLLALVT